MADIDEKLVGLRTRLVEAQRSLLRQAADAGGMPSDSALRRIADLESAIVATDALIEEGRAEDD